MGEATERPWGLRLPGAAPLVLVLLVPIPAEAFELSGGVSLGGFQVGSTLPRLAVTPHVGLSWRRESGFLFVAHDLSSILTPVNKAGLGVFNKASITIGYGWEEGQVSICLNDCLANRPYKYSECYKCGYE